MVDGRMSTTAPLVNNLSLSAVVIMSARVVSLLRWNGMT